MKPSYRILRLALAVAAISTAAAAQAELVYSPYFASENVGGDITKAVTTVQARADFLTQVTVAKTETFEGFDTSSGAINASGLGMFGDPKASILPILPPASGAVTNIFDNGAGTTGRFNTTAGCIPVEGCNFLETAYSFNLAFGGSYSAFAFFGTDFSDFAGSIYIDLLEDDGNGNLVAVAGTRILVSGPAANNPLLTTSGTGDGSLLHFGWTDNSRSYAGISFSVVQTATDPLNYDFLGFDDLVLGNFNGPPPTDMPEPGSVALVALSLAGLALTRRRTLRG